MLLAYFLMLYLCLFLVQLDSSSSSFNDDDDDDGIVKFNYNKLYNFFSVNIVFVINVYISLFSFDEAVCLHAG